MLFNVALGVVALLVVGFLAVSFTRRDRDRATDSSTKVDAGNTQGVSGKEVERVAALARHGGGLAPVRAAPVALREPLDADAFGVTRRQFLNRSLGGMFAFALSGFGAACIAFLWPTLKGGFGSKINAGPAADALSEMADSKEPVYNPEGRFYLNPYPKEAVAKAKTIPAYAAALPGLEAGLVALYQKCPHLGCRVPWCGSSQWFECPCHGSQYNRVGEKRAGPAPRGMDLFAVDIKDGNIVVDTKIVLQGAPLGTDSTGQQIEGPHCA